MAGPGGFEPPTTGLGGRRSILAELRAQPGAVWMEALCGPWLGVFRGFLFVPGSWLLGFLYNGVFLILAWPGLVPCLYFL